jgi:hypothetical protein
MVSYQLYSTHLLLKNSISFYYPNNPASLIKVLELWNKKQIGWIILSAKMETW